MATESVVQIPRFWARNNHCAESELLAWRWVDAYNGSLAMNELT
jgi:hypothetical protein